LAQRAGIVGLDDELDEQRRTQSTWKTRPGFALTRRSPDRRR
jgi:hypothetical protein